jgi:hypothetical protein
MSRINSGTRFGFPTNATLKADITTERSVLSRLCADVETSVRKMARLVNEPGATEPVLGWHGTRCYPEPIDRDALANSRDEALRDAQTRLAVLQDLLGSLIGR